MRLTTAIGFTKNLPKMLEKVLSKDGTFFFVCALKIIYSSIIMKRKNVRKEFV